MSISKTSGWQERSVGTTCFSLMKLFSKYSHCKKVAAKLLNTVSNFDIMVKS